MVRVNSPDPAVNSPRFTTAPALFEQRIRGLMPEGAENYASGILALI